MATDEQIDNLERLANGLEKVREEWLEHFDMSSFVGTIDKDRDPFKTEYIEHISGKHPVDCGTTGCAVGWAPYLLGIPNNHESWGAYSERVFGINKHTYYYLFIKIPDDSVDRGINDVISKIKEVIERAKERDVQ